MSFVLKASSSAIFALGGILIAICAVLTIIYVFQLDETDVKREIDTTFKKDLASIISNIILFVGGFGLSIVVLAAYNIFSVFLPNTFAFEVMHYVLMGVSAVFIAVIWYYIKTDVDENIKTTDDKEKFEIALGIASSLTVGLFGFLIGSIIFKVIKRLVDGFEREAFIPSLGVEIVVTCVVSLVQSILCVVLYILYGGAYEGVSILTFKYAFIIFYALTIVVSLVFGGIGVFFITL